MVRLRDSWPWRFIADKMYFIVALRQTSNPFALHQIGTLQERYWILAAYLGLGHTETQDSFQIGQEEDPHAGYGFSVY
jgi:hypothetical protein